jgi:hypothetical protein
MESVVACFSALMSDFACRSCGIISRGRRRKFHFHFECVRECVISETGKFNRDTRLFFFCSHRPKTAFLACTSHESDFSLSLISCNCASQSRACVWVARSHRALIKRRLSKRSKTLLSCVWQTKPLIWGFSLGWSARKKPKSTAEKSRSLQLSEAKLI